MAKAGAWEGRPPGDHFWFRCRASSFFLPKSSPSSQASSSTPHPDDSPLSEAPAPEPSQDGWTGWVATGGSRRGAWMAPQGDRQLSHRGRPSTSQVHEPEHLLPQPICQQFLLQLQSLFFLSGKDYMFYSWGNGGLQHSLQKCLPLKRKISRTQGNRGRAWLLCLCYCWLGGCRVLGGLIFLNFLQAHRG